MQRAPLAGGLLVLLTLVALGAACAGAPQAPQAPQGARAEKPPALIPSPQPVPGQTPHLMDFMDPPGTKQVLRPFMLHADLWTNGIDQRAKLDTVVYALENGARTCRVTNADSLWAVDYTWIYPHSVFPERWYDARQLLAAADSLRVPDDAVIQFTFGTCRIGVRAATYEQARAEALRLWPEDIPVRLAGRLKLKVDRAKKALRGEPAE
ncbi:MAG: hypothetical protein HZA61_03475 [Candidatus Eisenbacteria bacterium]|uniref:Lipoprotein n=1 Tax=Eiseniibacteriota bacterium TaxID=2212470 RepID=A0A933SB35_UNCEI|nr:hypothetical protein [Candidatus Eisenbacteria bacterium]